MVGGKFPATQFSEQRSLVDDSWLTGPEFDLREPGDGVALPRTFADIPWPKVSVVIPTLNEARNLPYVFSKLPPALHEVIIVDGHSVDDTRSEERRVGKGCRSPAVGSGG